MNSSKRPAGKSTREMADKRYKSRVWLVLLLGGLGFLLFALAFNSTVLKLVGGVGFLVLLFLGRLVLDFVDIKANSMMKQERRAVRGAKAEEKIGSILDALDDTYFVIHDVSSPYGNIDHIVLNSQGGVFLIETKAHGGRVSVIEGRLLVNGKDPEKDFVAQALRNTYWLRDTILKQTQQEAWITPILVFTNAFVERTSPIKGVSIINKKYLPNLLAKPSSKAANRAVWSHREKVYQALCE